MSTVTSPTPPAPPTPPTPPSRAARFLQVFQIKGLNDWLPALLLIPGGILVLVYANPWIIGVLFILLGLGYCTLILSKSKRRTRLVSLIVPGIFIISGLSLYIMSDPIKMFLLDRFYDLTLNPRNNLNQKTESIIGDQTTLWPIKLSQGNRVIDIPDVSSTEVADFLSSSQGRLFFLTGAAGTGKTPMLRQWAHTLLKNHAFKNVFIINLTKELESLKTNPTLPELVARSNKYRDIVKVPDYYDMLFKARPCLIVLDELDEIDQAQANHIMDQASILVRQTPSKVLIGSRPESVLLSDFYRRSLQFTPDVVIYNIDALDDKQQDYFIKNAANVFKSKEGTLEKVKGLLASKPAVREMATQLDHLNEIVRSIYEFENKSEFEIVTSLVEKRSRRNEDTHGAHLKDSKDIRMKKILLEALLMSSQDVFQTFNSDLQLSGFVTVSGDQLEFSPRILQSYFAVRALELDFPHSTTFSNTILSDIARFQPVNDRLVIGVKEAFGKDPLSYHKSLKSVRQIIKDDDFILNKLRSSSSDDLLKKVIMAN